MSIHTSEKFQALYSAAVSFLEDHSECSFNELQKHLGAERFMFQGIINQLKRNDEAVQIHKSGNLFLRHKSYGLADTG